KILGIRLRVKGKEFTEVQDDDATLTFITDLGYKESKPESTKKKVERRRTKSVVIHDTPSVLKPKPTASNLKLKGVQSLTFKEQEAADTIQARKESKKTSKRQPGTGGLSKGTGRIPGIFDESIIDNDDDADDEDKDDDHVSDNQDNNDEDSKVESDEDEIYKNAKEKGDAKLAGNAMICDRQVKESSELPLPSSNSAEAKISSLMDIHIQQETLQIQSSSVLKLAPKTRRIPSTIVDPEQESEKSALEIRKVKKELVKKKKMSKYTIKSTNKVTLKEYDQKSALYQTMHENKSFNRNPANHAVYHALMEVLIEDENSMDKGVADTVKDHKRWHDDNEDDDEDPPAGPN
nr:hypothetical protein [Tanacetum cinerariifolium]